MSIFRKLGLTGIVLTLALVGIISCGGGTNNDQGASFTALGFVTVDEEGKIQPDVFDGGRSILVNRDTDMAYSNIYQRGIAWMAVQNNLCKQFVRLVRFDCDYNVQGTELSFTVPSDSTNTGFIVGAAGGCSSDILNDGSSSSSSSEEGVSNIGQGNIAYVPFDLVSQDVLSYLMVNQNSLPELPFRMTAICRAVGITQAGDSIVSNDLYYPVEFIENAECCTGTGVDGGGGFQTGTGTGGDPYMASTDSDSSASGAATSVSSASSAN
ncbi:MAG: hypothetical protein IT292_05980 [Deltaproteobacteria bacterium]|nr:hypothetical protein [Deltaproteobacteria bacterium]